MANRSKKEKMPMARKAKPRRTKRKVESALDVLSSLAEKFPEGLGPFERDKSERDFSKYLRKKPRGKMHLNLEKIPLGDDENEYTPKFRKSILKARREILSKMENQEDVTRADKIMGKASKGKGRFYSHADVLKKLKLKRRKKRK